MIGERMEKLRHNRVFKEGLTALLFCVLLCGFIIASFIVSKVQYDSLISKMKPIEATVVDVDWNYPRRGHPNQKIHITYEVDGATYSRKLGTDTKISFSSGTYAHYSVGDKIGIFYDPQDPGVIASPRSLGVGYVCMCGASVFLVFVLFLLLWVVKHHRRFLVTQQEYEKEKEKRKMSKAARKKQKKQKKQASRR